MYTRDKKRRRWTISRYPKVSLKSAREKALRVTGNEDDPARDKRRARKLGDFRSLADKYLAAKKRDLRPASAVEYERILTKVKEKFRDEPAAKIERRALRVPPSTNRRATSSRSCPGRKRAQWSRSGGSPCGVRIPPSAPTLTKSFSPPT